MLSKKAQNLPAELNEVAARDQMERRAQIPKSNEGSRGLEAKIKLLELQRSVESDLFIGLSALRHTLPRIHLFHIIDSEQSFMVRSIPQVR
jgi:hypothetical protein